SSSSAQPVATILASTQKITISREKTLAPILFPPTTHPLNTGKKVYRHFRRYFRACPAKLSWDGVAFVGWAAPTDPASARLLFWWAAPALRKSMRRTISAV